MVSRHGCWTNQKEASLILGRSREDHGDGGPKLSPYLVETVIPSQIKINPQPWLKAPNAVTVISSWWDSTKSGLRG